MTNVSASHPRIGRCRDILALQHRLHDTHPVKRSFARAVRDFWHLAEHHSEDAGVAPHVYSRGIVGAAQ